jgi:hypothetical protein
MELPCFAADCTLTSCVLGYLVLDAGISRACTGLCQAGTYTTQAGLLSWV